MIRCEIGIVVSAMFLATPFGALMPLRLFRRKIATPPSIPPGRRIYAIGDIHGRLDLFDQLLDMIKADQQDRLPVVPEILLLGDLIDRGPDSAQVIRRAMTPLDWAQITPLMGNHEASMVAALDGDVDVMRSWLRSGGRQTLSSWGIPADLLATANTEALIAAAIRCISREEISWLVRLRQYALIGDYFFVHAGVRPGTDLNGQSPKDSYWIRSGFLESENWHGAMIVHGHTISTDIVERDNRIGIDTGAYQSGRLSAIALERDQRWFLQT